MQIFGSIPGSGGKQGEFTHTREVKPDISKGGTSEKRGGAAATWNKVARGGIGWRKKRTERFK